MCFHTSLRAGVSTLEKRFRAVFADPERHVPSVHLQAFSKPLMPVISGRAPGLIRCLQWGLIPSWAKNEEEARNLQGGNFNARSEEIFLKPSWREPARTYRVLILADGFYEYHHAGKEKIPFFIGLDQGQAFAFGGLASSWTDPASGSTMETFSIITTPANRLMARIHNSKQRMPFILTDELFQAWLSPSAKQEELMEMMQALPDGILKAYPVSREFLQSSRSPSPNRKKPEQQTIQFSIPGFEIPDSPSAPDHPSKNQHAINQEESADSDVLPLPPSHQDPRVSMILSA